MFTSSQVRQEVCSTRETKPTYTIVIEDLQGQRNQGLLATSFHASFFLSLFLDPEDGGDMFLWNVG
jgi:hypothetical protein